MKQAIRALSWVTTILWILVILFSGTVVYSALQIRINFEEPQVATSDEVMTMSIPFSISNGGLYDISELNITTRLLAENEAVISRSTSSMETIPRGNATEATHDISLSINDILAKNLTNMLFNDTGLSVEMSAGLTYAYAIPLKISSNLTMVWGAPLNNLTVGEISIVSPNQVGVFLSFDNHAFFSVNGTIRLEIVDSFNNPIGFHTTGIIVPPGNNYDDAILVTITGDPREAAEVHLYFNMSVFSFGPVVISVEERG